MAGFARGTATEMTGNTHTPSPPVTPANMNTAAQRVEEAWSNRNNGQVAQDELHNATEDLNSKLHTNADYVTTQAAGSSTIIHSCGFQSTKSSGSAHSVPNTPAAAVIKSVPNKFTSKVSPVTDADSYTHIVSLGSASLVKVQNGMITIPQGNTGDVYIIPYGNASETFNHLPPIRQAIVEVMAHNGAGSSGLSPAVSSSTM